MATYIRLAFAQTSLAPTPFLPGVSFLISLGELTHCAVFARSSMYAQTSATGLSISTRLAIADVGENFLRGEGRQTVGGWVSKLEVNGSHGKTCRPGFGLGTHKRGTSVRIQTSRPMPVAIHPQAQPYRSSADHRSVL